MFGLDKRVKNQVRKQRCFIIESDDNALIQFESFRSYNSNAYAVYVWRMEFQNMKNIYIGLRNSVFGCEIFHRVFRC